MPEARSDGARPAGSREAQLAKSLGPLGAWSAGLTYAPAREARAAVGELERLGYRAFWIPEGGKDIFANLALILGSGERIVGATSIASMWHRSPEKTAAAARTVAEAYPGRIVLGLGPGHHGSSTWRGLGYERPLTQMSEYLDALADAPYAGPAPAAPVPIVLGVLGPRMLELARERSRGANTYLVPVAHTAFARSVLGPRPVLAVTQSVVLGRGPTARAIARAFVDRYLRRTKNYGRNFLRLGYSAEDVVPPGSERLLDDVVVCGDAADVARRVDEHLQAGADHVCVQILHGGDWAQVPLDAFAGVIATASSAAVADD